MYNKVLPSHMFKVYKMVIVKKYVSGLNAFCVNDDNICY